MSICKGYGPDCFNQFEPTEDGYGYIVLKYLLADYQHCLLTLSASETGITCGDLSMEYRPAAQSALFFKNEPPAWDVLARGEYEGPPIVIVESRKFSSNMSSIGRGLYVGEFSGKDLAEWIAFWEKCEGKRRPLSEQVPEPDEMTG